MIHEAESEWQGFPVAFLLELKEHSPTVADLIVPYDTPENHQGTALNGDKLRVLRVGSPAWKMVHEALLADIQNSHHLDGAYREKRASRLPARRQVSYPPMSSPLFGATLWPNRCARRPSVSRTTEGRSQRGERVQLHHLKQTESVRHS